jgi:hypothetical protein
MSGDPWEQAKQVAPHGRLRRHVPPDEASRTIGMAVIHDYLAQREPPPQRLALLADTYRQADEIARQRAESKAARRLSAKLPKVARRPGRPATRVLVFTRGRGGRWRARHVPLLEGLTVQTEGNA